VSPLPREAVAIEIARPGPPEVLRPARRPVVPPGPGELLVRVAAAGVNRPDLMQREGKYPPPAGASDIPGLEVAGTGEKCAACERLGAERAINYREEDFAAVAKAATGGRGVDVILDMVGGSFVPRDLDCLAREGRLVLIAFLGGPKAEVDLRPVLQKWLTITGSTLRARSVEEKGRIAAALREKVWPLLESGAVGPVIHATYPLAEAAAAHRLLESGAHVGKVVLVA